MFSLYLRPDHFYHQQMNRMKNILSHYSFTIIRIAFLVSLFSGMISCSSGVHTSVAKGSLMHQTGKGYTVFCDTRDTVFYMIQYKDSIPFPVPEEADFQKMVADTLTILNLKDSSLIQYHLDQNVYGLGKYTNNEYFELLTDSSPKGFKLRNNIGDLITLMSCLCHPAGEEHNCQTGGKTEQTCSTRLVHKVGKEIWTRTCDITCSQGYNACCN